MKRLKWIARLEYGSSLSENDREEGHVPVYGSNGVVGKHSKSITGSPAIIIGRKGSHGKVTNTKSNLKLLFKKLFDDVMADMYENDLNFYKKIEGNPSVKELIKDNLFEDVFKRSREAQL